MASFIKPLTVTIILIAFLYFFYRNDEPTESNVINPTEAAKSPQSLPASEQGYSPSVDDTMDEELSEPAVSTLLSNDPCEVRLNEIETELLNKIVSETTLDDREPLFILTGWDWITLEELQQTGQTNGVKGSKARQINLLREKIDDLGSPLYLQRYLQECVTNDIPKYCQPEELERIAEQNSDNINVWLLLIHYYNNRSDNEKIAELIGRAANATVLENYANEYIRLIYDELLLLTNSSAYSAGFAFNYRNTQLFGLESVQRSCSKVENVNCFQIGENLEKYGFEILTKRTGILIQLDYLSKTNQVSSIEIKRARLSEIDQQIAQNIKNFKMPFDDDMANYMIETLETKDELEYYEKVSQEATRILNEKPELCFW